MQAHPSAAVFPGGDGLAQMQARAVAAIREHDRRLALAYGGEHGSDVLWLGCTHGDVIKAVVADALGMHLDAFQRVSADPGSVSVVRYTELRPFVLHVTTPVPACRRHCVKHRHRRVSRERARRRGSRAVRCRAATR